MTAIRFTLSGRIEPVPYLLLAGGGCALFAWLTPTHDLPWASFHAELGMALAGLFAAIGVWLKGRRRMLALPALAALALLAALIPLTQAAFGLVVFRGDAVLACLYLAGLGLTVMVGYRAVELWGCEFGLEALAWLVLLGALASSWLALYQWQQLDYLGIYVADMSIGRRPFANFNQSNLLATLLVLGIVATGCLFDRGRIRAALALVTLGLLCLCLATTQSRAGLLEVPVAAMLLLLGRRHLARRLRAKHVVVALAVVLTMSLVWESVRDTGSEPTGRDVSEMMRPGARGPHWAGMLDAIGRHPWLGYGWNQGAAAQLAVAPRHPPAPAVFDYGHNLALDLVLWNGIPLGFALLAGLGFWFVAAARDARDSSTLLALAGVVAVFFHALLEFPLYYSFFLLPVGLLMGGVSAAAMPRAVVRVPAWFAPTLMVAVGAVLAVLVSDYRGIARDVTELRFEQARIGVSRARAEASRPWLLTQMAAFIRFAHTPEREGMTESELGAMAAVVQRFPSGPNAVRYAAALALNGRPNEAADVLRPVCRMDRPPMCERMQVLWRALGERQAAIAKVPWPAN
ncbi:MAG: Wzy polymerase domain-containing protein [Pseudomonadota bacterium]